LLTFLLVVIGWVLFRAPTLKIAAQVYYAMAQVAGIGTLVAWAPFLLAAAALIAFTMLATPSSQLKFRFTPNQAVLTSLMLTAAILMVGSGNSPFLYYQF